MILVENRFGIASQPGAWRLACEFDDGHPESMRFGASGAESIKLGVAPAPDVGALAYAAEPMIQLTYSNRSEDLLDALAADLARLRERRHPLEPLRLVLPDRNLEAWVKQGLARRLGIAGNLEVHYLRRFVAGLVEEAGLPPLLDGDAIYDGLLALFLDADFLAGEALGEVRAYLHAGGDSEVALARRRHQLARRLSLLFEEYGYSRPLMVARWEAGEGGGGAEGWQRALWRELRRRKEGSSSLASLLDRLSAIEPPAAPLHLFGISHVAHAFHRVLARLAEGGALHVYTLNPCREFWEDLPTVREARRGYGLLEEEDPFGLSGGGETPPLSLWGRPGRENIRLLNELTDCDFREAFSEGQGSSLLHQVQDDILHRRPERTAPEETFDFQGDRSIEVLEAPGTRREAEAIAARIWELVEADPSLRFNEIAVAVAGRDPGLHFSHLKAAFEESYDIPFSLTDVSMVESSEVGQAVGMLLDLLVGRFEREPMLRFLTHPSVRARYPDADPAAWERLVDRLGIFLGADRRDLEGTYVEEDALNWDQGLRRLALGALLPDEAPFEVDEDRYLPEAGDEAFGALVRSLLSDLRAGARAKQTTAGWARFLDVLVQTYVIARGERERAHLDRCLSALRRIAERPLEGRAIACALAVEMAKEELTKIPGGAGRYLAEGVVVSTLRPMRAIPFRVLFVMGLGEGLFPSADRRDPLDLRLQRFQPGDVSPRERDQYMFLEALLCARERFILSYVGRDEQTGDALPPSPVLQALLEMLEKGYTGDRHMVTKVPLRHWESERPHPAPRAAGERWAARIQAQVGGRVEIEELAERMPAEQRERLEKRLGLVPLPEEGEASASLPALRFNQLRRFLECPIQGSATARAGLREDEEDLADRPREPFETALVDSTTALREAIQRWLRLADPPPLEALWEELRFQRLSSGRAPAGVFGAFDRAKHLELLRAWTEHLGPERPRLDAFRFGGGREGEWATEILPPLSIGGEAPVLLEGRTEAIEMREERRVSFLFATSDSPRHLLRPYLDHLVLTAAGRGAGLEHAARRFASKDFQGPVEEAFAPLSPERAEESLASLAADLFGGDHEVFLPCEAVFKWWKNKEKSLVEAIEGLRGERERPSSSWGPVRDAKAYPAPSEEEARAIAERRFGLFFELWQPAEGKKT